MVLIVQLQPALRECADLSTPLARFRRGPIPPKRPPKIHPHKLPDVRAEKSLTNLKGMLDGETTPSILSTGRAGDNAQGGRKRLKVKLRGGTTPPLYTV